MSKMVGKFVFIAAWCFSEMFSGLVIVNLKQKERTRQQSVHDSDFHINIEGTAGNKSV